MGIPAPKPSIDTCHACGKLFPRSTMQLCAQCALVDENRFALVKRFVAENNGAPLTEVARGTGVSVGDVRRFLDGGRLVELGVQTCTCGGVGTRCKVCRAKLAGPFREMERSMQQEPHAPADSTPTQRTSYVRRIHRTSGDA